jgi:hypothetical protein
LDSPEKFVREGIVDLGPKEDSFTFVDGEYLGKLPRTHFGVDAEPGYTSPGRLRVTVERVEKNPPRPGPDPKPRPSW